MKKCNSCGESIHRSSNVCSYCGNEQKKFNEKILSLVITGVLVVVFLIYIFNKPVDKEDQKKQAKSRELIELQVKAENTVKKMMKDPESVKFRDQIGPCGYYNGKNSFGAYTGYKRYIIFQEMNAVEDINVGAEDMNRLWQTACKY